MKRLLCFCLFSLWGCFLSLGSGFVFADDSTDPLSPLVKQSDKISTDAKKATPKILQVLLGVACTYAIFLMVQGDAKKGIWLFLSSLLIYGILIMAIKNSSFDVSKGKDTSKSTSTGTSGNN